MRRKAGILGFDCPARGSRIKAACGALRVGSAEPRPGRRSPGICACEDDGQDQVLSEYILLPTAKLVAPRSVRAGDSFVRVSA